MKKVRGAGRGAPSPGTSETLTGKDLEAMMDHLYPGGVPNIYRMLARNSAVMAGLAGLKLALEHGRLTQAERGLVALEVAREAECGYCLVALRHYLATELDVPEESFCASTEDLPPDPRARLVVSAARSIIAARGRLSQYEIGRFADQGLVLEDLIEIIAVVGEYTIATYAANLDRTRLDPEYRVRPVNSPKEE